MITAGYGRSESVEGEIFPYNFPLLGTYWDAADILVQHVAKINGGFDKLKGKKITLVYHDSPYGKEPIALLTERSKLHGFELQTIPVTHPGVEQKAAWLQIRQNRPDYVFLWGWGVMNSTACAKQWPPASRVTACTACGGPRPSPTSYRSAPTPRDTTAWRCSTATTAPKMHEDILKLVHGKGSGNRAQRGSRHRAVHARHDQRHAGRRRRSAGAAALWRKRV